MRLNSLNKVLPLAIVIFFLFLDYSLAQNSPPFNGEVTSDNINIRADSTPNAQIICTVNKDERLDVILELYDWYKIRLPKKAPSFVKKDLTECLSYQPDSNACRNAKISKNRVNIRLKPHESSPILGKVNKNEVINIRGEVGGWYKIEPASESFGWIHKNFVKKAAMPVSEITVGPIKDTKDITVEGMIKPYGKIFKRIATHKLITPDNKTYLLKGNKRGLDALNHHKVKIQGTIIDAPKEKYPVIEVRILAALNS